MAKGHFITVEGIDGVGKSTQAALIEAVLDSAGYDVLRLREPGGVKISEQIRAILLDPANAEMGDVCELLLYEAARAQLVHQVIRPALAAGKTVVCDRFYDSTTAYQAFADGLDRNMVSQANELAVDGCRPDLTLVFDLPVEDALRRRSGREAEDRLELKGMEFQERVAAGFRAVAADEPDRAKLIDAGGSIAEVFSGVAAELRSAGLSVSEDDVAAALQACQGKC
ncbi:MAG: dTMP kinase [Collinsella intestinalis]|nr:dTMP kinase [Collinsella intestinalis]